MSIDGVPISFAEVSESEPVGLVGWSFSEFDRSSVASESGRSNRKELRLIT